MALRAALADPVVRRFAAVEILLQTQFWFPVWFLFLRDLGFAIGVIVLADAVFRVVVVVCEVPLGVLADRLGRRRSYLLLAALTSVTYAVISQVEGTVVLFAAWIVWGVQWALTSGTATAYLVDALKQPGAQTGSLPALSAVRLAAGLTAVATLGLAGPLYSWDPRAPWLVSALCAAIALPLIARLPALKHEAWSLAPTPPSSTPRWAEVRSVVSDPRLRPALVLAGLVLFFGWSVTFLFQPLVEQRGLDAQVASWLYVAYAGGAMGAGLAAPHLGARFGQRVTLLGMVAMLVGCAGAALAPGAASIAPIALVGVGYQLALITTELSVAERARPGARATALSLVSAVAGLSIAVGRSSLGLGADRWSAATAFMGWALLGGVLVVVMIPLIRRVPLDTARGWQRPFVP